MGTASTVGPNSCVVDVGDFAFACETDGHEGGVRSEINLNAEWHGRWWWGGSEPEPPDLEEKITLDGRVSGIWRVPVLYEETSPRMYEPIRKNAPVAIRNTAERLTGTPSNPFISDTLLLSVELLRRP